MENWTPCSRKLWRAQQEASGAAAGNSATGQSGDSAIGQLSKANEKRETDN
jgi:hypothetical protein